MTYVPDDLVSAGVEINEDLSMSLWHRPGEIKATHKRVSIADCIAIALADQLDARIVTSDHRELDPLDARGICRALFIR